MHAGANVFGDLLFVDCHAVAPSGITIHKQRTLRHSDPLGLMILKQAAWAPTRTAGEPPTSLALRLAFA
jgi:hypothetical protein